MNLLDTFVGLCIALMGASPHDSLKNYNVLVDESGQLSKVVLESAKVRVTIEKLPPPTFQGVNGIGSVTNILWNRSLSPAQMPFMYRTNGMSDPRVTAESYYP